MKVLSTKISPWSDIIRGVAIGDAWGDPVEFSKIESIVSQFGPTGPDLTAPLRITDDTQMSLYLARALHNSWGKSRDEVTAEICKQFLAYNVDPDNNRAPGITVTGSLGNLARVHDWKKATSSTSDGSGTVMRTSACAFLPQRDWVGITALAAAITHGTANAIAAAILNVAILRALIDKKVAPGNVVNYAHYLCQNPRSNGLLNVGPWLHGYEVNLTQGFDSLKGLLTQAQKALPGLKAAPWDVQGDPSRIIGGGGWRSHETIVIALMALDMLAGDPWASLRRAVASDGDSDTLGAVAGGLVGAAYPGVFSTEWESGLRDAFETRYVKEIEEEADHYIWNM